MIDWAEDFGPEERRMSEPYFHHNKYSADAACKHCDGVIRHESWCITLNAAVMYAYAAILDAAKLSQGDHLTLHALGVIWQDFKEKTGNAEETHARRR